jgi:hypothetical protein
MVNSGHGHVAQAHSPSGETEGKQHGPRAGLAKGNAQGDVQIVCASLGFAARPRAVPSSYWNLDAWTDWTDVWGFLPRALDIEEKTLETRPIRPSVHAGRN